MINKYSCLVHLSPNCYANADGRGSEKLIRQEIQRPFDRYFLIARNTGNKLRVLHEENSTIILLPVLFRSQMSFLFYQPMVVLLLVF